jgi:cell division protein FtsA
MQQELHFPDHIAAALDVGSSKISLTLARKNNLNTMEILAHASIPTQGVKTGTVHNLDKVTDDLRLLKQQVEEKSGVVIEEVCVNMGSPLVTYFQESHSIFCTAEDGIFTSEDVSILTENIYRMVLPSGFCILHVIPEQFTIDYEIEVQDPVGVCGTRLDGTFKVICVDEKAVAKLKKCIERVGMQMRELLFQPLSSSQNVLNSQEKELGVCVVDIGAGTTDLAIYKHNRLQHLASLPFGSNLITADLSQGLGISILQAEAIKTKLGHAIVDTEDEMAVLSVPSFRNKLPKLIPVINIACIIESRLAEILEAVHREILSNGQKLEAGIVITGGGALLPKTDLLAQWVCNLDVRIGYPTENVDFGQYSAAKNPTYAAGIGLAWNHLFQDRNYYYQDSSKTENKRGYVPDNISKFAGKLNTTSFLKMVKQKARVIFLDDVQYDIN